MGLLLDAASRSLGTCDPIDSLGGLDTDPRRADAPRQSYMICRQPAGPRTSKPPPSPIWGTAWIRSFGSQPCCQFWDRRRRPPGARASRRKPNANIRLRLSRPRDSCARPQRGRLWRIIRLPDVRPPYTTPSSRMPR